MNRLKSCSKIDVLGLGVAPLDILYQVERLPQPGEKIDATDGCVQGGGPVPNMLVGMARLGYSTSAIVTVGDDAFGRMSLEELHSEKIDTRFAIIKSKPSAVAIGMIEQGTGQRTIALLRQISISARDIILSELPPSRLIHMDGRDMAACIKLARWGRKQGAVISLDIGSVRNDVTPLIPLVDHLVVADAFALPYTGSRTAVSARKKLKAMGPGCVVVTEGTKGAVGLDGDGPVRVPAFEIDPVDTTGAGDSFHAGYFHGLLEGLDLKKRMQLGAATAALKCTRMGARTGAPTLQQLNKFLKSSPKKYA